jgi:IS605 OrfB family transposase
MKLVKQIQVNKNHPYFEECDRICFNSKNLYNQALYRVKLKHNFENSYLNYFDLTKELNRENQLDFRAMQAGVSQQTLMLLDKSYKSFFNALRDYKVNPNKYKSCPKPPKFKHKENGRFQATFTENAISKKSLKKGLIKLAGVDFTIPNAFDKINQVRIIPKTNDLYCIEIVYEKQELAPVTNKNYAGIDIGLNNLAAVVTNDCKSFIVNGRPLKSINQYYNKKLAKLKSELPFYKNTKIQIKSSNKIKKLTCKRNNKIKDYLHKASTKVVNTLKQADISKIVIGQNKDWKQSINIGKKTNQNFVSIPHANYINMITYKAQLLGMEVICREESYTSKCSFLDNETVRKHNEYKGRRIKRGMFRSEKGLLINSDINGSCNILKKEVPNAFANGIEGILVFPIKYSL